MGRILGGEDETHISNYPSTPSRVPAKVSGRRFFYRPRRGYCPPYSPW